LKARKYERLEKNKKNGGKPPKAIVKGNRKESANANEIFLADLDDQEFDYVDVDGQN